MPLQGKFVVDNKKIAVLTIYGVGAFPAFSGNGIYRNRGGCTAVKDNGPLPSGKYWIVDRQLGVFYRKQKHSLQVLRLAFEALHLIGQNGLLCTGTMDQSMITHGLTVSDEVTFAFIQLEQAAIHLDALHCQVLPILKRLEERYYIQQGLV